MAESQAPVFERIPKPYPGEHFKDQFPDKIDPRGEPEYIEFRWNRAMRKMDDCDTFHMLYLVQIACELFRRRINERNAYYTSISRPDQYRSHVDAPQIISNFLKWHSEDREENVFNGEVLTRGKKLYIINDLISEIGGTRKGPATRIFSKLRKRLFWSTWTESEDTTLKLYVWGIPINPNLLTAGWIRMVFQSDHFADQMLPSPDIMDTVSSYLSMRIVPKEWYCTSSIDTTL